MMVIQVFQGDQDHQWVIKESLFSQFKFDMLLFETDTHIAVHIKGPFGYRGETGEKGILGLPGLRVGNVTATFCDSPEGDILFVSN